MVGGDETEWPTARKLEHLRSQGIVPHSRSAAFLMVAAAAALTLWGLTGELSAWWGEYRGLISTSAESGAQSLGASRVETALAPFLGFFLLPAIAGALGVLVLGMFQSRFLVRLGACGFDLSRVMSGKQLRGFSGRSLGMLLRGYAVIAVVALLGFMFWPLSTSLTAVDRSGISRIPELVLRVAAFGFGVIGTAIAVIALVWSHIEFRRTHRMTRAELLSEAQDDG